MSTRDDLIDLAARGINDEGWTCTAHEPDAFGACSECEAGQRRLAARLVDALHDRLVGRLIEKWTWCVTCERPVNVHRPYRHDGHSIPGDRFAICDGPLEILQLARPAEDLT